MIINNIIGGLQKSTIVSRPPSCEVEKYMIVSQAQEGGAQGFFKNNTKFFIMANVNNDTILSQMDNMRTTLLLGNKPLHNDVHITLLQFNINQDHRNAGFFFDPDFHQSIRSFYDKTIGHENLVLNHKPNIFDLLGLTHKKFFAKLYYPDKPLVITDFRTLFYKYIGKKLGKYKIREKSFGNEKHFIFNIKGKDLIAIPGFYFGKAVWTPHVSIVNIKDIQSYNMELYEEYMQTYDSEDKINVLLRPLINNNLNKTNNIKMNEDINFLRISLRNPDDGIHIDSII